MSKMTIIAEANEWDEDHSISTMVTSKAAIEDKYRKEVRTIKVNGKEFTFDPRDRIFGLKQPIDKDRYKYPLSLLALGTKRMISANADK